VRVEGADCEVIRDPPAVISVAAQDYLTPLYPSYLNDGEVAGVTMGCDIHVCLEVKLRGTDTWEHCLHSTGNRCYRLFGRIAGVRDISQAGFYSP
jgi:hypothetical protein